MRNALYAVLLLVLTAASGQLFYSCEKAKTKQSETDAENVLEEIVLDSARTFMKRYKDNPVIAIDSANSILGYNIDKEGIKALKRVITKFNNGEDVSIYYGIRATESKWTFGYVVVGRKDDATKYFWDHVGDYSNEKIIEADKDTPLPVINIPPKVTINPCPPVCDRLP